MDITCKFRVLGQRGLSDRERSRHPPGQGRHLIGNGPDVLTRFRWSATIQLDAGVGTCGKDGQSVWWVGQPTLKIESLTVGGTQA